MGGKIYMKKKIIIIFGIVFSLAILVIPIPAKMKDGGTVHYNAILYDIFHFYLTSLLVATKKAPLIN